MQLEYIIASAVVWWLLLFLMIYCFYEHHRVHKFPQNLILFFLGLNVFCRLNWSFMVIDSPNAIGTCLMNRLALFCQSCAITILLLMWRRALITAKLTDKLAKIRFENEFKNKFSSMSEYSHMFEGDSLIYNPILPSRSVSFNLSTSIVVKSLQDDVSSSAKEDDSLQTALVDENQESIEAGPASSFGLTDSSLREAAANAVQNGGKGFPDERDLSVDDRSERASMLSLFSTTSDSVYNFQQVAEESKARLNAELKQKKVIYFVFFVSFVFWFVIFISLFLANGEFVDMTLFLISFFFLLQAILTLSLGLSTCGVILREINQTIIDLQTAPLQSSNPSASVDKKLKPMTFYQLLTKRLKIVPPGILLQYEMMKNILFISVFLFLASLLRSICFAILTRAYHEEHHEHDRRLTRIDMDESDPLSEAYAWLYPWAFYQVPEIASGLLIAWGISPPSSILRIFGNILTGRISQKETIFIDSVKKTFMRFCCCKTQKSDEKDLNWWEIEGNAQQAPATDASNGNNASKSTFLSFATQKSTPYLYDTEKANNQDNVPVSPQVLSSSVTSSPSQLHASSKSPIAVSPAGPGYPMPSKDNIMNREKYSEFIYNMQTVDDIATLIK